MKKLTRWICAVAVLISMTASLIPAYAADDAASGDRRYNIMLVIDGSASLLSNRNKEGTDPAGMRYELVKELLGCLEDDGHYIGAMVFSGNRNPSTEDAAMESGVLMQTGMMSLDQSAPDGSLVKDYVFKEILKAGVDGSYNGTTDIGTALLVAERKLQEMQKENGLESLVFLFTDGVTAMNNPSAEEKALENMETATREMHDNGIRLFGVFLNQDGYITSTEIADAVCAANGITQESPQFENSYVEIYDAASCHRAVDVLLRFLGYISGDMLSPKEDVFETNFTVPGIGVREFTIRLYSYKGEDMPEITVEMTQPDGTILSGDALANLCRTGRTFRIYKITNPQPGSWTMRITVPNGAALAYVYDKVYSLDIGARVQLAPDVEDLLVNSTVTFTAALTQDGKAVTDPLAYEGYECCLEITDFRTNQTAIYPITNNNNGVFVYGLPLQDYGSFSARVTFSCDHFSVSSTSITFELVNHEPTITGTVRKTVKYGPFQDKTSKLDLSEYFNDPEDGKNLRITLVESDCDENAIKLKGCELVLTSAKVGSGEIVLSITDSQGAGGQMKVIVEAKSTLPLFIALGAAILMLAVVAVCVARRPRRTGKTAGTDRRHSDFED